MLALDFEDDIIQVEQEKPISKEKIVFDMPNDVYHSRPEISSSQIKNLLDEQSVIKNLDETESIRIGTLGHEAILEPDKYKKTKLEDENYTVIYKSGCTRTIERSLIDNIYQSYIKSSIPKLGKNGIAESSIFGEIDGVKSRCRPDLHIPEKKIVIDLKITNDASPDGFAKSCAKFGYYIQEAWYRDVMESAGFGINDFIFVAICSKPISKDNPLHKIGVYRLNEMDVEFGRSEYQRALDIYRRLDTYNTHVYKDSSNGSIIQTLTLPNYIRYKHNASMA
jgi:exodeoxyribonuclease VIII